MKEEFDVEDVVGDERLALLIPRNATTRSINTLLRPYSGSIKPLLRPLSGSIKALFRLY